MKRATSSTVSFAGVPAVAEEGDDRDSEQDEPDENESSFGGDTMGDSSEAEVEAGRGAAVAAKRAHRAQPAVTGMGSTHNGLSAARNELPEVGNLSLMIGNWGKRSENIQHKILKETAKRMIVKLWHAQRKSLYYAKLHPQSRQCYKDHLNM